MSFVIELIPAIETLPLRQKILRPSAPLAECINGTDEAVGSFHLGGFVEKQLVTVASFHVESQIDLPSLFPYRLRGMATEPEFQGKGYGRQVLVKGMDLLHKQKNCDLLWFNARKNAYKFYETLGFSFLGEEFEIPQIGPHKVMYLRLL